MAGRRSGARITGSRTLRRTLARSPDAVKAEAVTAVGTTATTVEASMLAKVPRASGDLASVIKTKFSRDKLEAKVGPGIKGKRDQRKAGWRAHYQEFGTVNHRAQPFVRPAFEEHKTAFRAALVSAIRNALLKMAGR